MLIQKTDVSQLLKTTDIFAKLSAAHLEAIAKACKVVKFKPQARIVNQGDSGDELFMIASGRVAVIHEEPTIGSEQLVTTLGERHCFGETSILSESPRSATIKALEETTCVVLAKRSFESVLTQIPEVALEVSRFLAARLHHQCQLTGFRFVSGHELKHDPELIALFPQTLLTRLRAVPMGLHEDTVTVALTNPNHPSAVRELKEAVPGLAIEAVVCSSEDYESFKRRHYLEQRDLPTLGPGSAELSLPNGKVLKAPLSSLICQALEREVGQLVVDESAVLTPADNGLERFCSFKKKSDVSALRQQLQEHFFQDSEGCQVSSLVLQMDPGLCHLKVSRLNTLHGARFGIQILDSGRALPEAEHLIPSAGLLSDFLDQFSCPGRTFLLAGLERQAVDNTAYALLLAAKRERGLTNLLTVEENPALDLQSIPQVTHLGQWEQALQAALMQFPRGLLLRDLPNDRLLDALGCLHEGVSTLVSINSGDPIEELAAALRDPLCEDRLRSVEFVVTQKQIPRLCPHCREKYEASQAVKEQLHELGVPEIRHATYRCTGCQQCHHRATAGTVPVFSSLTLRPILVEMLRGGRSVSSVKKAAADASLMLSYVATVALWLQHGEISPPAALKFLSGEKR